MKFSGFWRRNIAILIDLILIQLVMFPVILILGDLTYQAQIIFPSILLCLYFVGMTSSKYQGSFGQKIMSVKVGNIDGSRITILQSLIRFIVWGLPFWPLAIYMSTPEYSNIMNNLSETQGDMKAIESYITQPEFMRFMIISNSLGAISLIGAIIWSLTIALTKEKTGPHDLMCKQRVFNTKEQ